MGRKKNEFKPILSDAELEEKLKILAGIIPKSLIPDSTQTLGHEEGRQRHTRPQQNTDNQSGSTRSNNS